QHGVQSAGFIKPATPNPARNLKLTVIAFAGIFQVPSQYVNRKENIPPGLSLGEASIGQNHCFIIFFIFDAISLFTSLVVVVVHTSVVVIQSKAKKQLMVVINKILWLACMLVLVAYLALLFVVVGDERWLAIGVIINIVS
ncbi:hypothetical protein Goklo_024885, partial [Gossypium klotzschianum]|nr:hypothetical protein [Gossypium klotzschianum]